VKTLAVVCNIVLVAFTFLVLMTDGLSRETAYTIFALLLLSVPILSAAVVSRSGVSDGWLGSPWKRKAVREQGKSESVSSAGTRMNYLAMISNIVLFGFVCWALVDQYPHPEEEGFVPYAVLTLLTPILNLVVIVRGGAGGWLSHPLSGNAPEGAGKPDSLAGKQND
jgi:hypothetical protein